MAEQSRKPLGVTYLALLVFYEVSGGPIGVEGAVGAGGPLLALLGFALLPFAWSVPEALLTAELAVAFPENSGYVAWVKEAFGNRAAFVEGLLKWTSGVVDNAVYPLLFLEYFFQLKFVDAKPEIRWLLASIIGVALAYLNWRGLKVVGRAAAVLCLFTLLPFVVMILIGLPKLRFSRLVEFRGMNETDWPKLLNVLFWNLNYWEAISTLAGEVEKPSSTFPRALLFAVVLVICAYALPLTVGIGATRSDPYEWEEGHFVKVAQEIAGRWLQIWVILVAAASAVGLFEAEMSSDAFMLAGMAERGMLPAALARRSKHGTPTLAIVLSSIGIACLALLDFTHVLELLNFLYCIGALLEFSAYIRLRSTRQELFSSFRIGMPTWAVALLLVPAAVLISLVMVLAAPTTIIASCAMVIVGLLLQPLMTLLARKQWAEFEVADDAGDEDARESRNQMTDGIQSEVEMGIPVQGTERSMLLPKGTAFLEASGSTMESHFNTDGRH